MTEYYWLNEDSRIFLERGYLKRAKLQKEELSDIAETAEAYLGMDGFADKFVGVYEAGILFPSFPCLVKLWQ